MDDEMSNMWPKRNFRVTTLLLVLIAKLNLIGDIYTMQ